MSHQTKAISLPQQNVFGSVRSLFSTLVSHLPRKANRGSVLPAALKLATGWWLLTRLRNSGVAQIFHVGFRLRSPQDNSDTCGLGRVFERQKRFCIISWVDTNIGGVRGSANSTVLLFNYCLYLTTPGHLKCM